MKTDQNVNINIYLEEVAFNPHASFWQFEDLGGGRTYRYGRTTKEPN